MARPGATPTVFRDAEAYERFIGRWTQRLAPLLLEFAGVRDGDRILDVGSGTGSFALAVAAATRRSEVVGIEPAAAFVAYAKTRTRDPRVRFEAGDAQSLPYADRSFDRAVAMLVVQFIPEADPAVAEMRRVTRPGGTVAACVWDATGGMEMLRVLWDAAVALDPAAAVHHDGQRPLSRPGEVVALWQGAGLRDVHETGLVIPLDFASFEDLWAPNLTGVGPVGAYVATLAPDRQQALRDHLYATVVGPGADGPFTLRARSWAVRGTVPDA